MIGDIKSFVCSILENKKQAMISDYDDKINRIINTNNPAVMYYLLSQTFQNTMEQGEIQIKLLRNYFKDDFFKDAKIENEVNYISFSNDAFKIMFSKTMNKEIKIKYNNPSTLDYFYKRAISRDIEIADLIESYLKEKNLKNFKALVLCYCCRHNECSFWGKIQNYIRTYKNCNENLLKEIRLRQEEDKIRLAEVELNNQKFDNNRSYVKTFINNLKDLNAFKDEDWWIKFEDHAGKFS